MSLPPILVALLLALSHLASSLAGVASWYPAHGLIAAAGPALRHGDWRGRAVDVCLTSDPSRCVRVRLADWCQCYGTRLLDLSDDAFSQLAPLSRGLIRVTVSGSRPITLPQTDATPLKTTVPSRILRSDTYRRGF